MNRLLGPAGALIMVSLIGLPLLTGGYFMLDAGDLVGDIAEPGIAHPTGYPLYIMLGHLWGRLLNLLGGTWPLAANSFSLLWFGVAGAAFGGAFREATFFTEKNAEPGISNLLPAFGFLAGLLLWAVHPDVVFLAVSPEVYSMHVGLVALIVWAMLRAGRKAAASNEGITALRFRHYFLLGLLGGLGITHHLPFLIAGPPLALFLILAALLFLPPGATPLGSLINSLKTGLPPLALGGLCGFLPWLYLLIRSWSEPFRNPGRPGASLSHFIDHVTGAQYRYLVKGVPLGEFLRDLSGRFTPVEAILTIGTIALMILMAIIMARRAIHLFRTRSPRAQSKEQLFLILAASLPLSHALLTQIVILTYRIPDLDYYFLSIYWDTGLALAIMAASPRLRDNGRGRARLITVTALALGIMTVALPGLTWTRDHIAFHHQHALKIRKIWLGFPEGPGVVVFMDDAVGLLKLWHDIEPLRPDLYPLHVDRMLMDQDTFRLKIGQFGMEPFLVYDRQEYPGGTALIATNIPLLRQLLRKNIKLRAPYPVWKLINYKGDLEHWDSGLEADPFTAAIEAGWSPKDRELISWQTLEKEMSTAYPQHWRTISKHRNQFDSPPENLN